MDDTAEREVGVGPHARTDPQIARAWLTDQSDVGVDVAAGDSAVAPHVDVERADLSGYVGTDGQGVHGERHSQASRVQEDPGQ